ncbi:LacI family transcriptional regulator [Hyphomicrobiales bacterium]|nr:LacI family transcriptional regulator [Hyphomicrobiales bacterium]CAH1696538.1 LacI family transcriptional regulator [Hyphomicrobiales bacterium]
MSTFQRALLTLFVILWPFGAVADTFPARPIRVIVPFAAGGSGDIVARLLGERAAQLLGQNFIVENRAGAGGVTGTDGVAKAPPDGYTIGLSTTGPLAINVSLMERMPYDPVVDFAPVMLLARAPELLVAGPKAHVVTLDDLVSLAKQRPGQISFGSSGTGSLPHLAGELLRRAANIDLVHVPYRGVGPAANDVVAGQIELMFADLPVLLPQVQGGAVKALGLASNARSPALPEVPTMVELGFPSVQANNWYAIIAPKGTPPDIVAKLHSVLLQIVKEPVVASKLADLGLEIVGGSPESLAALMRSEIPKWAEIVRPSAAPAKK